MNKCKKVICVSIGLICFTLGAIGIILPILPTTPFLLLASFFFVKGSERFDLWFKNTKIYKKHLDSFVKEKAMTLKQKMTILLFADFMMAFPLIILDSLVIKSMIVLMIIIKYYYFLFVIKTINN
ncbi:YbaN family protein [Clostridium sp. UBA5119]|uniref:YbaN family protein n=1 Tax=Clostridium sp. UBA5119 TaxID=1946366 RepID=UPI003217A341